MEVVVESILFVAAIAYALWILLAWFIGYEFSRQKGWTYGVVVGIILGVAPLVYIRLWVFQTDGQAKQRLADQVQINKMAAEARIAHQRLTERVNAYFEQVCATERRQITSGPAVRAGGVILETNPDKAPRPSAPTWEPSPYWAPQIYPHAVLRDSQFSFVEKFAEGGQRQLQVAADNAWWVATGPAYGARRLAPPDTTPPGPGHGGDRRGAGESGSSTGLPDEGRIYPNKVATSRAKYVFNSEDMSSTEDRRNLVARGRMRLSDRSGGVVLAEYIGFALNAAVAPGTSEFWEKTSGCPGEEQRYRRDRGGWDAAGYFFKEVVAYE